MSNKHTDLFVPFIFGNKKGNRGQDNSIVRRNVNTTLFIQHSKTAYTVQRTAQCILYEKIHSHIPHRGMITVHAGQCGNQLGYCVLDSLFDHLAQPGISTYEQEKLMNHFFRRSRKGSNSKSKWVARSVCIDTEPKVIHDCINQAKEMNKWLLSDKQCHYEYGGAGNNWARGYQLFAGEFRDASMNSVRLELEEADVSPTIMVVHSIGGGTGSGLGTRMTEEICDEFSDVTKLNVAVMPFHFGEVVVQDYNSVLCLSKAAEVSDAVLLFENEHARELCVKMHGVTRPTLYDINRSITADLVPALIPKVLSSSLGCDPGRVNALLATRGCRRR